MAASRDEINSYVAVGAPGKDETAAAVDADLLAALVANPFDPSVPPLFCVLFNMMGIWPAWFAAALLPGSRGQKPLPAGPFIGASVAAGMFALSPYLALRQLRATPEASATQVAQGLGRPPSLTRDHGC